VCSISIGGGVRLGVASEDGAKAREVIDERFAQ